MPIKFLYSLILFLIISGCKPTYDSHSHQTIYNQSPDQYQYNSSQLIHQTYIQQKLKVLKEEDQDRKRLAKARKLKLQQAIREERRRLDNRFYQHQTQFEKAQHQASLEKLRLQLKREEQHSQQESERLRQEKMNLQKFLNRALEKQQQDKQHQQQEQRDLEQALKNSLETKIQEDARRHQQMIEKAPVTLQKPVIDEPSEGKLVEAGAKIMTLQKHLKETEGRNASRAELSTHLQGDMNINAREANSILDALDIE